MTGLTPSTCLRRFGESSGREELRAISQSGRRDYQKISANLTDRKSGQGATHVASRLRGRGPRGRVGEMRVLMVLRRIRGVLNRVRIRAAVRRLMVLGRTRGWVVPVARRHGRGEASRLARRVREVDSSSSSMLRKLLLLLPRSGSRGLSHALVVLLLLLLLEVKLVEVGSLMVDLGRAGARRRRRFEARSRGRRDKAAVEEGRVRDEVSRGRAVLSSGSA